MHGTEIALKCTKAHKSSVSDSVYFSYIERRDFAAIFEEESERAIWRLWSFVDEISLASIVDAVEEIDAERQGRSVGTSVVALLTRDATE